MAVLAGIVEARRRQTEAARRLLPLAGLKARVADLPRRQPGRFSEALLAASVPSQGRLAMIAELKRYSPSAGAIRPDLDLEAMAGIYEGGGAAALSVLTEEQHFGGSPQDLARVRQVTGRPLLSKDFHVEPYTIYEARLYGADAVLLIVRLLSPAQLADLVGLAHELGMDALVEVHAPDELPAAVASGARLIGINNRDLESLRTDLRQVRKLAPLVPKDHVVVAESGYREPADVAGLPDLGVRAVLVGESVLRAADPAAHLRRLALAGRRDHLFNPSGRRVGVKICGLKDEETIRAAADAGADALGLVFYPPSRRFVPRGQALRLVHGLRSGVAAGQCPLIVGLFVDAPVEEVVLLASELGLDVVQLQGKEDPFYLEKLRRRLEAEGLAIRILLGRAFSQAVEAVDQLPRLAQKLVRAGLADALLVDRQGVLPGGNGARLEWSPLATLAAARRTGELPLPWGLAGGLDPRNVEVACSEARPDFVDVSSGVEVNGRKDVELIRQFIEAARRADSALAADDGNVQAEPQRGV